MTTVTPADPAATAPAERRPATVGGTIAAILIFLVMGVVGLAIVGVVLAVLYMIFHSLFQSVLAPIFGFFGGIFLWAGDIIGTLIHPVNALDAEQNMWTSGLGSLVIVYLIACLIVYGILSLFGMSRGWKVAVALFLPIALLLFVNRRWRDVGGGWERSDW